MGVPQEVVRHVSHERVHAFLIEAARALGMSPAHAQLLADLLVANDLRGNLTHGSLQIHRYANEIRQGRINATPNVQCTRDTPTSHAMEGDGGLGYFAAHEGTLRLIDKASSQGMAAMVTRFHGHIGAAGIYTRMAAEADLIAFFTSGVQLLLHPGLSVTRGAGGSPMSFSAPAGEEPDLVVDIGVTHEIQGNDPPHLPMLVEHTPSLVLRALSLGNVCQTWGGLLTGLPVHEANLPAHRRAYVAADQGAMMFAFKVSLFAELEEFKAQVDEYARAITTLKPIDGVEGAYLPGSIEAQRERRFRQTGIPLGATHERALTRAAQITNVPLPWD